MSKTQIKYVKDPEDGPTVDVVEDMKVSRKSGLRQNNPESAAKYKKNLEIKKNTAYKEWEKVVNLVDRLRDLDEIGMGFLKGEKKLTKEQLTIWKELFAVYSAKLIPNASPNKNVNKKEPVKFNIFGAPKKSHHKKKVDEEQDDTIMYEEEKNDKLQGFDPDES